ncbi:protein-methionine-sulfoxide reductase heme-binding subunit MsrQ [Primorskyibacter flagellatus]|uniref:Protein-methionine-sulfoxide reductase heme-binding subunit MsrQ n=1 Tax=Primorskyibacter flagellatus TaxID=1387277 RepID=A0A917EHX8_9RHOB|nr:protein-methionine-sulfoxide reductase heme-binding subunit MsrQ [Primorskyibacter flagellatus]GGE37984.1 protein-methionine-sulfoxide reductase heme-binding subunit MsrQ [Primorskyibacter flagellatus]
MATTTSPGPWDRVTRTVNDATRKVPAWPLYIIGAVPPVWIFVAGLTGQLGVDPVKAMEHQMGEWSLWLIIAGLCITPLQRFAGIRLLKYRRAIGLLAFFYILGHLLIWLVLDVQIPSQIIADIVKRPYVTVGFAAFLMLIPLALTSNNRSIRWLGAGWRKLHQMVYAAAILGALHFIMLVKGFQLEPFIYAAVILALLALRLSWFTRWSRRGR